jgi:hypothetical protein
MVLQDSPTLALPDTPTLVLQAPIDPEIAVTAEQDGGKRPGG